MKKHATMLIGFLSLLMRLTVYAQVPCTGAVTNPQPYIVTDVTVPIEQYLARSISFDGFFYDNAAQQQAAINAAVSLKAAFLLRTGGYWGHEDNFRPATDAFFNITNYTTMHKNFIQNINCQYDQANYRHPIIQASVFTEEVSTNISYVVISPAVINDFRSEIAAVGLTSTYFDAANNPVTTKHYEFNNMIRSLYNNYNGYPDITKLQARMWIYQQAIFYISVGYTSLHMGQVGIFAWLDAAFQLNDGMTTYNVNMQLVDKLMTRIRTYASSTVGISNLILVSEPSNSLNSLPNKFYYGQVNGRDKLIFDYAIVAARLREILPQVDTKNDVPVAYQPATCESTASLQAAFAGTACASGTGVKVSTIDRCFSLHMKADGGGITPAGRVFNAATPYAIYLDFGDDEFRDDNGNVIPKGTLAPGTASTWGYDDARWYSSAITSACRIDWTKIQLARVREFIESTSFLGATGRVYDDAKYNFPVYRLADHADELAALQADWVVKGPQPSMAAVGPGALAGGKCSYTDSQGNLSYEPRHYPEFQFKVTQPDVTSIYTWHIQKPDNSWEPITYGQLRVYDPTGAGTYHVSLKQDNLGLPGGATSRTYTYDINVTATCYTPPSYNTSQALVKEPKVELFSRPSTTSATIQLSASGPATVAGVILDITGRQVLHLNRIHYNKAGINKQDIDVSSLPTGVYICRLLIDGKLHNLKLVKE